MKNQINIFEILMDAICCVMCADRKITTRERKAIHEILEKTKAPWDRNEIENRINNFVQRVKDKGLRCLVEKTCEKLPEFKRRGKENVLLRCIDYMARADGVVDMREMDLCERFKLALGVIPAVTVDQRSQSELGANKSTEQPRGEQQGDLGSNSASHAIKPPSTPTPPVQPEHVAPSDDPILSLFLARVRNHCVLVASSPETVKALQGLACDPILKELEKYVFSSMVSCLDKGNDRIVCEHKFVEGNYLNILTVVYATRPAAYIRTCFRGGYLRYLGHLAPEWPSCGKSLAHWVYGIGEEKQVTYLSLLPHPNAPRGISCIPEGDLLTRNDRRYFLLR